ncbi:hypothetical protein G7043_26255 [Lentzea sp. NEAU-D13]|uniref:Uncharacterized protein n=1 Tax=Lentzea alba TaxID=2714351 RepID=A0A7C9VTB4_9PSEU|nr:hypothetical protein [Lentzea alba]NGY62432.1 hypothetical protein [Lentzea alba]
MSDLRLEHAPDELPQSRPSRRTSLVVLGVLAVVVLGAGTWWTVEATRSAAPNPQSGTCVGLATPDSERLCIRQAEDRARRAPVTAAQRTDADSRFPDLDRVIHRKGLCLDSSGNPCAGGNTRRSAVAADAEVALQRLKEAGFGAGSVVRVAREGDLAPVGSLFYAAELPTGGCVIGHVIEVPAGAGGGEVVGKLPSGRCAEA